jgi:hypothetical protein
MLGASSTPSQLVSQTKPTFHFEWPQDIAAFFGCASATGTGLALQSCLEIGAFGTTSRTSVDVGLLPLSIVPTISFDYYVPNGEYLYFTQAGVRWPANPQGTLRFSIGFDTKFTGRSRWGNHVLMKVGASCLVTSAFDQNSRREGCERGDLDNWFLQGTFSHVFKAGEGRSKRDVVFIRAEAYYEMPDHDIAAKQHIAPAVNNPYNDDGQSVTILDVLVLGILPLGQYLQLKPGGGVGHFYQAAQESMLQRGLQAEHEFTRAHADLYLTWTPNSSISFTAGSQFNHRYYFTQKTQSDRYWLLQSYMEWRP